MHNLFRGSLVALVVLTSSAPAKRIAIPPLPDRIGGADAVVAGKVTALEDRKIKLPDGSEGALAIIKVEDGLTGAKGLTHVKVAINPGQLTSGLEGCFFLNKVKGETHYRLNPRAFFSILRKEDGNYEAQMTAIKRCAALLDDPNRGLRSKNPEDRLLTAALLLARYRPWGHYTDKVESIDATQSKLILEALADADWKKFDNVTQVSAQALFGRLNLTPADGWTPTNFQQLEQTARQWLKANAGTHRVKRFVLDGK